MLFALDAELDFPQGHHYRIGAATPGGTDRAAGSEVGIEIEAIGCAADCGSASCGGGDGGCGGGCGGCGG